MARKILIALNLLAVAVLMWLLLSWLDVTAHNCAPGPVYAAWNAWPLLMRLFGR